MKEVEIIEYTNKYHDDFKNLNYKWLKNHDLLEPLDEIILNNPEEKILDKGGHIFLARYDNNIVGTACLIYHNKETFEIAKVAVSSEYRGLGIGSKLVEKCIEVAKKDHASRVILYSNSKLRAALGLYKKFGFKEISSENIKYEEADIKMELTL